jgi:aryl-alcohol dehydrogenase-like predicted oxidoreductase
MARELPKRTYGKTGVQMPILALGGAGVLQDASRKAEAIAIVREAVEQGVYYLDTAQQYRDSERIFGEAIDGIRSKVFLSTKSARRDYDGAWRDLENSLKRLRTDRLEQWIVHHVSYPHEIDRLFAPDGAIKAFQKAKEQKIVQYVGISGHNDPQVIRTAMERFPFDMVLFPLNPTEPHHPRTFAKEFLEYARRKGVGLAVMKVMGRGAAGGRGQVHRERAVPLRAEPPDSHSGHLAQQPARVARAAGGGTRIHTDDARRDARPRSPRQAPHRPSGGDVSPVAVRISGSLHLSRRQPSGTIPLVVSWRTLASTASIGHRISRSCWGSPM